MGDDWDEDVETAAAAGGAVELVSAAELPEIKLFGKWSCDEVNVSDMSLQVKKSNSIVINNLV
jgi:small subunit ribosomal protein S5e